MHRISTILLIFLAARSSGDDNHAEHEGIESSFSSPATDEPIFTLEIPDYVIIEQHNATDYIVVDNIKQHVMGISDERCDNANVSADNKFYSRYINN